MSLIVVPCPYCSQASRLDLSSLPDQPTYFPCPHCKEKVTVHKSQLMQQQAPPETTAAAPQLEIDPPSVEPPAPASAVPPPAAENENRFGRLPENASFPAGIVLGDDEAGIALVQEKLAILGGEIERMETAEAARHTIIEEQRELCIFVASGAAQAPYAPLAALTGLAPELRRNLFLVLVADNLKTLDGNSAFMFQVNLIVSRQDLAQFGPALHSGLEYHRRLYRPYLAAVG